MGSKRPEEARRDWKLALTQCFNVSCEQPWTRDSSSADLYQPVYERTDDVRAPPSQVAYEDVRDEGGDFDRDFDHEERGVLKRVGSCGKTCIGVTVLTAVVLVVLPLLFLVLSVTICNMCPKKLPGALKKSNNEAPETPLRDPNEPVSDTEEQLIARAAAAVEATEEQLIARAAAALEAGDIDTKVISSTRDSSQTVVDVASNAPETPLRDSKEPVKVTEEEYIAREAAAVEAVYDIKVIWSTRDSSQTVVVVPSNAPKTPLRDPLLTIPRCPRQV